MAFDLATKLFMLYTGMVGVSFLAMPEEPLKDSFPNASTSAMMAGKVYHEVVGALSLALCVGTCPGAMGAFMSSLCWVGVMAKHIYVDGLQPPLMVQAMGGGCAALCAFGVFSKSNVGKWAFMAFNALNAFVFFTNGAQVVQESFPDAKEGTDTLKICMLLVEVIGTHCVMQVLTNCPPPLGRAMAMTALLGLVAKHRNVDNVGPPLPVLGLMCVCSLVQYYAVFTKKSGGDKKKES